MAKAIFDSLNRHVNVSHETFDKFISYHDLLLKWQAKVNLIGNDTIPDIWNRHFLDSLQLLPLLSPTIKNTILDFGSGAGFPGMVLAISGIKNIHLVESDLKKVSFLREVARITDTDVSIHHGRIETRPVDCADVIVSRACSSLTQLCEFSLPYVSHGTICLFHKGKNYTTELEEANEHFLYTHTIHRSITDSQSAIIELANIRKRGYDKP